MTSAWCFKEPLRNETKSFLISKFCFPWLVYTLTPSNSTHYYLTSAILPFIQKISQPKRKLQRIYVCTPSLDKVLLVNSSTLIGEKNSSFMIQIGTGDWLSCELWTIVISIWNNHRWAEGIENKRWLTMRISFYKEGECRSISAKPTSIKKGKDIPKLPEIYKKLYQYFRLFHCHSYNNIAVIFHCFYM